MLDADAEEAVPEPRTTTMVQHPSDRTSNLNSSLRRNVAGVERGGWSPTVEAVDGTSLSSENYALVGTSASTRHGTPQSSISDARSGGARATRNEAFGSFNSGNTSVGFDGHGHRVVDEFETQHPNQSYSTLIVRKPVRGGYRVR